MKTAIRNDIGELIDSLVASEDGGRPMLAARLGVSESSLLRWLARKTRPQPDIERRLRSLAAQRGLATKDQPSLFAGPTSADGEANIRVALSTTLRQVRSVLHSTGRLSSRHEALDEISKLLFSHVISLDTGGSGITPTIIRDRGAAASDLRNAVAEVFRLHLPVSLSHELTPADFALRLKDSENSLALSLVDCFAPLATASAMARIRDVGSADLLNDTFGQFVVDSFSDEKELGQYLTPPEVVRFMVGLGLHSLSPEQLDYLCSPSAPADAGVILDPSCGVGSFLAEAMRRLYAQVRERHPARSLSHWVSRAASRLFVGIDKSERMVRLALTNLALFGAPSVNLHLANALDRKGADSRTNASLDERAILILTNPPFGASFNCQEMDGYRLASTWRNGSAGTLDSELLFLERYIDWLAPGGVLVAVVPDSILTNQGAFAALRRGLAPHVELLSVVSLPPVTFAAAGTSTKTSVLHLRKRLKPGPAPSSAYFAVCNDIGFDVINRGSQRARVATGSGQLEQILRECNGNAACSLGGRRMFDNSEARWDANYHAGLPTSVEVRLQANSRGLLRVSDVATVVAERTNPARFGDGQFRYIEISDVDGRAASVAAKRVDCAQAPSRARKLVRAGDVLISTVRPERRVAGVVPKHLDGAVCSTGIAVLRPKGIHPLILVRLVQSDFVNAQLLRNNIGIAYPAFDENCLDEVVLPARKEDVADLQKTGSAVLNLRERLSELEGQLDRGVTAAIEAWSKD